MAHSVTRRRFLTLAGGTLSLLALPRCSQGGLSSAPTGDAGESTRRLRMLSWPLYIDEDAPGAPGSVARFTAETGTEMTYSEDYSDNVYGLEQVFGPNLFQGKSTGYDIIVPTYWLVADLLSRGLLNEIPLERVPNHANLDPTLLGTAWDPGARFHLPWQAGFTGITYNPALTGREIRSFADLLDPSLAGRVGMVSEMREVLGFFMLAGGDDPSRATVASADAALDRLEAVVRSGQVTRFTGDEYVDALQSGEFAACLSWSGGAISLAAERPDLRFVIPAEGGIRWFDSMVIPKGADNVAAAGDWMNFAYDPANAARITLAVGYVSPVVGVKEVLLQEGGEAAALATSPILFPDDDTKRKLVFWAGTTPAEEVALQERFTAITGS